MPKPEEINFDFIFEYSKIWKLDISDEEMPIEEFKQNLDIAYLEKEGTDDWNLTLQELISAPEKQPEHYKKIKNVQMKYPIEIYFFKGSWKILDGVHRYCRVIMEGKKTVRVRKVTKEMILNIFKKSV